MAEPSLESLDQINLTVLNGDGHFRNGTTPEDIAHDNARRAGLAASALLRYAEKTGSWREEPYQVVSDLLGDLRHLTDLLGIEFDAASEHGAWHYREERAGR